MTTITYDAKGNITNIRNVGGCDQKKIAECYGMDISEVHLIEITGNSALTEGWNAMGNENGRTVKIDAVVILTHASPKRLDSGGSSGERFTASEIPALDDKGMGGLILLGCNAGHTDYEEINLASEFSKKVNGAPVLASDGTEYPVSQEKTYTYGSRNDKKEDKYDIFPEWVRRSGHGDNGRDNNGWMVYKAINNRPEIFGSIGKELNVIQMLKRMIRRNKMVELKQKRYMEFMARLVSAWQTSSFNCE